MAPRLAENGRLQNGRTENNSNVQTPGAIITAVLLTQTRAEPGGSG